MVALNLPSLSYHLSLPNTRPFVSRSKDHQIPRFMSVMMETASSRPSNSKLEGLFYLLKTVLLAFKTTSIIFFREYSLDSSGTSTHTEVFYLQFHVFMLISSVTLRYTPAVDCRRIEIVTRSLRRMQHRPIHFIVEQNGLLQMLRHS